jgi:L-asparaginase II
VHRGSTATLNADGTVASTTGSAGAAFFPRAANKPMQAAAMVECGLDLDGKLLALAAASHFGEDFHVAGVREILARAGLDAQQLQCPPDLPLDESAQRAVLRRGGGPDRVHMNCSGKHAAMLATCVAAGWPTDGYREPGHPLQLAIARKVGLLAGQPVAATGVDGCGAPLFAIAVTGLARAFRALVLAAPGSAERRVADAMRAYPEWTSGSTRPERALMAAVPGLLVKSGAEGVEAFALADGRSGAFKIDDGGQRARPAITIALLAALGADESLLAGLGALATPPVLGGGQVVGEIKVKIPAKI